VGKFITLRANMFRLKFSENKDFQHCDVSVTPEIKSSEILKMIFKKAASQLPHLKYCVFDGKKNMYSPKPIQSELSATVSLPGKEVSKEEKKFSLVIKPVATVPMYPLKQHLQGHLLTTPRDALQALDIILRYQSSLMYTPIGRSFYYPKDPNTIKPLGGGSEVWLGHFQSVRATQYGCLLNIDTSALAMVEPKSVIQHVRDKCFGEHLRSRGGDLNERTRLNEKQLQEISSGLVSYKVQVTHLSYPRKYVVIGISNKPAAEEFFECEGKNISVVAYFKSKYNIDLKYKYLPTLLVGKKEDPKKLPLEVCRIAEGTPLSIISIFPTSSLLWLGQRQKKALNPTQRRNMLDATCQQPYERYFLSVK